PGADAGSVGPQGLRRGRHQGSEGRWDTRRALSYRTFCPFDSRRVNLWYLSAGLRYTTHRPGTFSKVAEASAPLDGKASRAVVVHSRSQDQRRQQPWERASRASSATREASVHAVA